MSFETLARKWDDVVEGIGRLVKLLSFSPQFYPWAVIPPNGKSFDPVGVIGMPASGGGAGYSPGVETAVLTLVCPKGYNGIVYRISNNFLGPNFNPQLPSITWRIRNGASISNSKFVDNYQSIVVEFGTTNQPRPISGIFISSGQTLIYTVTNNDATLPISPDSQVVCCFSGFFWPQQRANDPKNATYGGTAGGPTQCAM